MPRDIGAYLQDILDCISEIESFLIGIESKTLFIINI